MVPLFHAFKVSFVVVEASVVAFILDDKLLTLTMLERPYSDRPIKWFLWVCLPSFRPCRSHFS